MYGNQEGGTGSTVIFNFCPVLHRSQITVKFHKGRIMLEGNEQGQISKDKIGGTMMSKRRLSSNRTWLSAKNIGQDHGISNMYVLKDQAIVDLGAHFTHLLPVFCPEQHMLVMFCPFMPILYPHETSHHFPAYFLPGLLLTASLVLPNIVGSQLLLVVAFLDACHGSLNTFAVLFIPSCIFLILDNGTLPPLLDILDPIMPTGLGLSCFLRVFPGIYQLLAPLILPRLAREI